MTEQVVRDTTLTLSTAGSIYGASGLFDLCSDNDLMSLSFNSQNQFLDWLGWRPSLTHLIKKNYLLWARAESDGGSASEGWLADPCGDANGVEWGTADFVMSGFGRLRRHGPTRDSTMNEVRLCETQPRYRLDGSQINSDAEYDMRVTTEVILQDLKRLIVNGSASTAGQFNGLENLIKTGVTDSNGVPVPMLDSIVVDMNGNGISGGAGMTWSGQAISDSASFIDIILNAYRRIRDRIRWSPVLNAQPMRVGDIVLVAPTHILRSILDQYTFWSVQPGVQYNEVNLNTYEARNFRNSLNGGMFGDGRIYVDGFEIPLMAYDWGLTKSPTLSDAYLLTRGVGNVRVLQGEFLDMRTVPAGYPDAGYSYTDGGRLLTWTERDGTCVRRLVEMRPRLLNFAPWAQVRFQDIAGDGMGGILSPDPWETSFFPESSFGAHLV